MVDISLQGTEGTVSVKNIGEHAAFDVRVQPFLSIHEGKGNIEFGRIPVVEKDKSRLIHRSPEAIQYSTAVLAATAFYQIALLDTLVIHMQKHQQSAP